MGNLTTRQLQSRRLRQARVHQLGQLQPGEMLQERYRIVGTLGVGGFSSVYQARDMRFPDVTRLCAIKEMISVSPDSEVRELTIKSFEREASILATLDHPAIVDVYDYFSEENRSYLVLEFIRGKDLESWMVEQKELTAQELVLDWALQICDVLAYLHNRKPQAVIFRDLKPSNIMLDPHGRVRLIDFNIAKLFQTDEKNTTIGTEGYAPPEQYRGEASPAGDVYSLGATIHHLLTRQDPRLEPPFSFPERPIHAANPNVSPMLEAIVMRCVNYSASDRYSDAITLKQNLLRVVETSGGATATLVHTASLVSRTENQTAALPSLQSVAPADRVPQPAPRAETAALNVSTTVQPLWRFKCEDEIRSRPFVANGIIYVGAYDNNLYALDADEGKFLWKFPASDGIGSSPSVYKDSIFIGSVDKHVYSLRTHSGHTNWRFATDAPVYSSPTAKFDHVFFGSDDGYLYAVNALTGRLAWKTPAHSAIRSSPIVTDEYVFFGTEGGLAFCVDLSGKIKWQFEARRAITATPAVANDIVYIGSMDSTVYALDSTSGWAIWRFRSRRPIISSPAVYGNKVYIGSADGSLYALDADHGRKLWSFETDGQIASSPAVWQQSVYFGSTDRNVYSLNTDKGQLNWQFSTGGLVVSSPTIVDGIVYIGSADHYVYALPG